ncbi:MAG: hypothetical protein WC836_10025 [Desulfobacula sp.]|jgi:hypothetical protein
MACREYQLFWNSWALKYIEKSGTITRELRADLLGYLWTSFLKPLTGGLNFERKKAIAELVLYQLKMQEIIYVTIF